MKFVREQVGTLKIIRSYEPGEIRIQNERITNDVIVSPQHVHVWDAVGPSALCEDDFSIAFGLRPEILIFGTGERLCFPSAELTGAILARQIGFEVMDTAAACRTYNILALEGRDVVAALLLH